MPALKRELQHLWGKPRFQQRLLHEGTSLADDFQLAVPEPPLDLQLLLVPLCSLSGEQAMALNSAALRGDVQRVEELLQRPQDPNWTPDEAPDWSEDQLDAGMEV